MPIAPAFTLLFTALKLTGFIDWSWWWITCPVWGACALYVFGSVLEAVLD